MAKNRHDGDVVVTVIRVSLTCRMLRFLAIPFGRSMPVENDTPCQYGADANGLKVFIRTFLRLPDAAIDQEILEKLEARRDGLLLWYATRLTELERLSREREVGVLLNSEALYAPTVDAALQQRPASF